MAAIYSAPYAQPSVSVLPSIGAPRTVAVVLGVVVGIYEFVHWLALTGPWLTAYRQLVDLKETGVSYDIGATSIVGVWWFVNASLLLCATMLTVSIAAAGASRRRFRFAASFAGLLVVLYPIGALVQAAAAHTIDRIFVVAGGGPPEEATAPGAFETLAWPDSAWYYVIGCVLTLVTFILVMFRPAAYIEAARHRAVQQAWSQPVPLAWGQQPSRQPVQQPTWGQPSTQGAASVPRYFLLLGGTEYGPYQLHELRSLLWNGTIYPESVIRPENGYAQYARSIPGLYT